MQGNECCRLIYSSVVAVVFRRLKESPTCALFFATGDSLCLIFRVPRSSDVGRDMEDRTESGRRILEQLQSTRKNKRGWDQLRMIGQQYHMQECGHVLIAWCDRIGVTSRGSPSRYMRVTRERLPSRVHSPVGRISSVL